METIDNPLNERVNNLNVDFNVPINKITIFLIEKVFRNIQIKYTEKNNNTTIYKISHYKSVVLLFFNTDDDTLRQVDFTTKLFKTKIKQLLPYRNLLDLVNDMLRLGMILIPLQKYKLSVSQKSDFLTQYYSEIKHFNGIHITKTINNQSQIFLNRNLIISLNHEDKTLQFKNNKNLNLEMSKYFYNIVCQPIYNFNKQLNYVRNELYEHELSASSLFYINNIILEIQKQFNEY